MFRLTAGAWRSSRLQDFRLGVTDEGAGTAILLLHPFPLDGTVLAAQADVLARERRVVRVDFPGFGSSPAPAAPVTIESYARALREVLAKKKISRADGLGLSIGSYALIELSRQAPLFFESAGAGLLEGPRGEPRRARRARSHGQAGGDRRGGVGGLGLASLCC